MNTGAASGEYGDDLIEVYDLMYEGRADVPTLPAFCRALHPHAETVLEFGIGSGRLAIPMAEEGFQVTGIEASGAMIAALAERSQGLPVSAIHGDFCEQVTEGIFDLVLILTNTLFMLDSIDNQRRALSQAAARLAPDGLLILETYDPYVYLERPTPFSVTLPIAPSTLLTDTVIVDRLAQSVTQVHAISAPGRIQTVIERSYWLTARELDLLAANVGLRCVSRFSDFEQRDVTSETRNIVSVYSRGARR